MNPLIRGTPPERTVEKDAFATFFALSCQRRLASSLVRQRIKMDSSIRWSDTLENTSRIEGFLSPPQSGVLPIQTFSCTPPERWVEKVPVSSSMGTASSVASSGDVMRYLSNSSRHPIENRVSTPLDTTCCHVFFRRLRNGRFCWQTYKNEGALLKRGRDVSTG